MDDVIIVGSLSDKELKDSIDALVEHVDEGTKKMAKSFDSAIEQMKNSLKSLGDVKIDMGNVADGGSVRRTKQNEIEEKSVKNTTLAYDQLASAMQKATSPKSAEESFYAFVQSYREHAAKLANEIKSLPMQSLDRQVEEYQRFENEINKVKAKIKELRSQLNEVGKDPKATRWDVKAITDQISLYEKQIKQLTSQQIASTRLMEQADKAAMEQKRAMYDETIRLIRELTTEEKKAAQTSQGIANAQRQQAQGGGVSGVGGGGQSGATAQSEIVRQLRERIREEEKLRESMELDSRELLKQNELIASLKKQLKEELMTEEERRKAIEKQNEALERQKAKQLKNAQSSYLYNFNKANTESSKDIATAEQKLRNLKKAVDDMRRSGLFDEVKLNKAQKAIDSLEKKIERMRSRKPMTLKEVIGMDESSVDAITRKMAALKRVSIDPKNTSQVSQLGNEYQRLSRLQSELLGKNIQLTHSNNYLAQSFGYIRNRVVYALTLGAATSFIKQIYEIRSAYELLERSIGVLVNSFQKGSQIFQELNDMALKSPFTLMELAGAAKQLTAYDFAANEVVNTTRRLADISAALGVPMERLTYNLGQIRAQTVLTARDARDFANAGLPIVKSLADYYTELEGRVVSTGDVYDRMKKKMVSYNDVMIVLNQLTDEGGKFFDFQAKQAETLRVQLANLTLAWNNMLNEIGEANQGVLTMPIKGLKLLFQNWQSVNHILTAVIVSYGAYKAAQMIVNSTIGQTVKSLNNQILAEQRAIQTQNMLTAATYRKITWADTKQLDMTNKITVADYKNILAKRQLSVSQAQLLVALNKTNVALQQALVEMGVLTTRQVALARAGGVMTLVWNRMVIAARNLSSALKSFAVSNWWMFALGAIFEVYSTWQNYTQKIEELNKGIANSEKESFESIGEFLSNYENVLDRLYTKRKPDENGNIDMSRADIPVEEATKAWEAMREKITESTSASNMFLTTLEAEADVNERLRKGFDYLDELRNVDGVLKDIGKDAIEISSNILYGIGGEGLVDDLDDYVKSMDKYQKKQEELGNNNRAEELFNDMSNDLRELRGELDITAESLAKFTLDKDWGATAQREAFERTFSQIAQQQELSTREYRIMRIRAEEQYYAKSRELLLNEIRYATGERKMALQERLKDLDVEFNTQKSDQETFFTWLQERQTSEVQRRLGDKTKEEIAQGTWLTGENKKWAEKIARDFSNEYGVSFNELSKLVMDANTWFINIPVYFNTIWKEPSDIVEDYEKRTKKSANADIQNAKSQVEVIDMLKKKQKELQEQIDTARRAGGLYWEQNKATLEEQNKALIDDIHSYNALTDAEEKAQKERNKKKRGGKGNKPEDAIAEALKQELSIIDEMRSSYDKLRKAGVSNMDAIDLASRGYEATIMRINNVLQKFGIDKFNASNFAGKDVRGLLKSLEQQRDALLASGKVKTTSVKDLDVKIQKLTVDAQAYDMKKVTDGLNNELNKLKDEYELAIELDANPELGNVFSDMFNIDVDALPQTFGEMVDRAQSIINAKLRELKIESPFDLMRTQIESVDDGNIKIKGFAENVGLDVDSEAIKELIKWQNTYREMFKKNITETEKMLDDYVKKYGDYSDKIAEVEANRLEKLKKLNEAYYTEEMRQRPEYLAKLNAINEGARKEKSNVKFDDFKNSRYYTMMFENLDYVSTKTIRDMRDRLRDLIDSMNDLTPEQLKQVMNQYEKLEQKLVKRSPFKTLAKDVKEYFKTTKERKEANEAFRNAQKEYDAQKEVVAALKEKYELWKSNEDVPQSLLIALQTEIIAEDEVKQKLKEQLELAQKKADQYNLIKKLALEEAEATAQIIAQNLASLAELRDNLQQTFGFDFGDNINAAIDGLTRSGNGLSKTISSLQSGNVVGAASGVVDIIGGIGDSIASIFGDGAARTKRINREIENSAEAVRRLNMAYKELEVTANNAMGAQELRARREQVANKQAQLEELKRQMQLEESKRSKDRSDDDIKQYQESIQDLELEIDELKKDIVSTLLGGDVKSAAESFVSTWVDAWRQGGDTMGALSEKFDDMIDTMIAKSVASYLVSKRLQHIFDAVDDMTDEMSEGGAEITMNELKRIKSIIGDKSVAELINEDLTNLYNALGIAYGVNGEASKSLSALQQGIQGITEETAGALEAYMNIVSQKVFEQNDLLVQIRDTIQGFDFDVQLGVFSQMLLQLQNNYILMQSIHSMMDGWTVPAGNGIRVELLS